MILLSLYRWANWVCERFWTAQPQMEVRIELRNGSGSVCFLISDSQSLCQAAHPRIGDHPKISPSRCASEGPKVWRGSEPAGWQCLPAQRPCHYRVPLRGMFFLFLSKFQRAFYPILIFKISCHLAFFKLICLYFIVILCTFETFTWSGILCDLGTTCYQKEPSTLGVNKICTNQKYSNGIRI